MKSRLDRVQCERGDLLLLQNISNTKIYLRQETDKKQNFVCYNNLKLQQK